MDTYIRLDLIRIQILENKEIKPSNLPSENDIKNIIRNINFNTIRESRWKFLDRSEPAISNINETQELRLSGIQGNYLDIYHRRYEDKYIYYSIKFRSTNKKISKEDLKIIANLLKKEFEFYLHYDINVFVIREIYIE